MNIVDAPTGLVQRFEAQRSAFTVEPYPDWPTRAQRLRKLQRMVARHEAEFAKAIDADFAGRPRFETDLAELWPSLEEVKVALREGRGWMKPQRAPVAKWFLPAGAQVLPQPLGVVGIIVPWNYPLFLAVAPMVAAIAAGNRVMVKMSEYTPRFSELFAALCAQAYAPDEVDVVTGAADVAAQFAALPFDHLLFTGSTAVGRKVMAAAAQNLTPVTLELGGKSPTVVAPGYPLAKAAERILVGKLLNAGQTCIAPDYVLLPREAVEPFVAAARETAQRLYPQGLADAHYCSVVDMRQYRRLTQGLDDALARGARADVLFAGAARDDAGHRLAPVLLHGAPADNALMTDEIFGPVLPVLAYDEVDEAIAHVNAGPRPLALYWFDDDRARTRRALERTHAGGVTVNDTLLHVAQYELPFGGVGHSGMGHYHGRWGFETFSKLKPVVWQAKLNAMSLFLPPYRPLAHKMLRLMKRV
ncbi:coniferyl aldehyde dehydrogenase [Azohydromonas sp.]|uniref:coniferyl aldehyde dehydrogenase n=1 Tax=Azohydromonas sp. TaxID=1872666 RepID=UPI002D0BC39F|nr:coniferyl aldehyde dehydrogenase [Azohydromonas sp.]HMM83834.1 coniferyl aldehyde dehydrogenase [Azohydromonas sp.]